MSERFRPWDTEELAIIRRLLLEPADGHAEMLAQLPHSRVRKWGGCPPGHCCSLEIEVARGVPLIPESARSPSPVQGLATDLDGMPIYISIWHDRGKLNFLEFEICSDQMKRRPSADDIEIDRTY